MEIILNNNQSLVDTLEPIFSKIARRSIDAVVTLPDSQAWIITLALLVIYAFIALSIGLTTGFLSLELQTSWQTSMTVMTRALFAPAIFEELLFRVFPLPSPTENVSLSSFYVWATISLAIFVLYHPLNALSFSPAKRSTFFNPTFLVLAALLGICCTIAYWQSASVWTAAIVHWLVVVIWLLCCGGYRKIIS